MLAYLGDPGLKTRFMAELAKHRKADAIAQGTYGDTLTGKWRGCAVGCSLRSLNNIAGQETTERNTAVHARYPKELGIPLHLAYLEDRIFEMLPVDDAKAWPERFSKAIHPGADLSLVWPQFAIWLLSDIRQHATERGQKAIDGVIDCYVSRLGGDEPTSAEWNVARSVAYAADAAAADAAAAAYANAATAAVAAAAAAADADAAAAAYATARSDHAKRQADALIEILEGTLP